MYQTSVLGVLPVTLSTTAVSGICVYVTTLLHTSVANACIHKAAVHCSHATDENFLLLWTQLLTVD